MSEGMAVAGCLTRDELDWLATVEAEWQDTTPGTWYPHATDDDWLQSAFYVSTEPSDTGYDGYPHDDRQGMSENPAEQADPARVVAITLLQRPRLAIAEACDQNTLFIANAHQA